MINEAESIPAAASPPGRRFWPNPYKKLGLCDIYELEKELNNRKKRGTFLNPDKRLRDCSEEELEEQLKMVREYKEAETYPNPDKELKDCSIQEIEHQFEKGFLSREDIVEIMKVKEISSLYCLQGRFCSVHGVKLSEEPNNEPDREDGRDTAGITSDALRYGEVKGLQSRVNSSLPPLKAGEYDTILPMTTGGLMIVVAESGDRIIFNGYRKMPDGSEGPSEVCQLIGEVRDEIRAVDGIPIVPGEKSSLEVAEMILERKQNKYVFIRFSHWRLDCFGLKEWKGNNPLSNTCGCQLCWITNLQKASCDGCREVKKSYQLYLCKVCNKQRCRSCARVIKGCWYCKGSHDEDDEEVDDGISEGVEAEEEDAEIDGEGDRESDSDEELALIQTIKSTVGKKSQPR